MEQFLHLVEQVDGQQSVCQQPCGTPLHGENRHQKCQPDRKAECNRDPVLVQPTFHDFLKCVTEGRRQQRARFSEEPDRARAGLPA